MRFRRFYTPNLPIFPASNLPSKKSSHSARSSAITVYVSSPSSHCTKILNLHYTQFCLSFFILLSIATSVTVVWQKVYVYMFRELTGTLFEACCSADLRVGLCESMKSFLLMHMSHSANVSLKTSKYELDPNFVSYYSWKNVWQNTDINVKSVTFMLGNKPLFPSKYFLNGDSPVEESHFVK